MEPKQNIFKIENILTNKRGVCKMYELSTNRLLALTDSACEFLLALIKKTGGIDQKTLLSKHMKIDKCLFDSKIELLKNADLIHNDTTRNDDTGEIINKHFSLTPNGEKALSEYGY